MIYPTVIDLLRTIDGNLVSKVEPSVADMSARSAIATIRHILRHVRVRVEREGQILTDDIVELRSLLPTLEKDLRRQNEAEGVALASAIGESLRRVYRPKGSYPDLVSLAEEAHALRELLQAALQLLIRGESKRAQEPGYLALRSQVRSYITTQVERQSPLVELAFTGFGPRR